MAFLDDDATSAGLSAQQIHDAMKGPSTNGTPTLDAASQSHAQVHAGHVELESMTTSLISTLTQAYRGNAAELANSRISQLLPTLRQAQDDLAKAQDLTTRQSGSFHDATNALAPVPPKPSNNLLNVVTPWHTDLDNQINQWNDAQSKNIAVYTSYTSASDYNHDGMPSGYGDVSNTDQPVNVHMTTPGSNPPQGPGPGGYGPGTGAYEPGAYGPGGYGRSGYGPGAGSGQPSPGGYANPGSPTPVSPGSGPTTAQGYQGVPTPQPGPGAAWGQPSYGTPAADPATSAFGGTPFAAGAGPFGPGRSGGTGSSGRGFGGGSSAGSSAGGTGARSQPGAGSQAGLGGAAGENGPAAAAGRPGTPGAAGASGMTGTGRGGKKEEDSEHKSAAYLEDDYSSEIVGELPRTAPPVIGLD